MFSSFLTIFNFNIILNQYWILINSEYVNVVWDALQLCLLFVYLLIFQKNILQLVVEKQIE